MDGWDAPQWACFNASVMSDVDEYFKVEHEELEPRQSEELEYHSCPSTPNSKISVPGCSPYVTPKSFSDRASQGLTGYMKNLRINSEKKFYKGKTSLTPRSFVLKNACLRSTRTSTPCVVKNNAMIASIIEIEDSEASTIADAKIPEPARIVASYEEIVDNLKFEDNAEDENAEQNRTLVASVENNENPSGRIDSAVKDKICEKSGCETIDIVENPLTIARENVKDEISREQTKKEISPNVKISNETSLASTKVAKDENSNGATIKLSKLTNRSVSSRRTIVESKKNPRCKPTVLTSHARRQSISKYRRASNHYVSLAEAVSKFQNCTPERFRSSSRREANKGSTKANGGSLQRVKNTRLKLTCATSPFLRCKYRTRAIAVPSQEEREILEIEEIRKNRIKPNPIRQSIMNPMKKLKTNGNLPETISLMKKTMINEESKKTEKKPAGINEAAPSTTKMAADQSKTLKKIAVPMTNDEKPAGINESAPSTTKTAVDQSKRLKKIAVRTMNEKKSTRINEAVPLITKTAVDRSKTLKKIALPATNDEKPAGINESAPSTSKTAADRSKTLKKIAVPATNDEKPAGINESAPSTSKTAADRSKTLKKIALPATNDEKPAGINESAPSTSKTAADRSKTLKKIAVPATNDDDSSSRHVTTMNTSRSLKNIKKSTVSEAVSSSRRTMINPPKSSGKINNEPSTISNASSSSRRTMINPPKPPMIIDNDRATISIPRSPINKTSMKPPSAVLKNFAEKNKTLVECSSSLSKKKDANTTLSAAINPESARKHTPCKKIVLAAVSTEDGVSMKGVEIFDFGVPVGGIYKKNTKTLPFNFETRNKESQCKREKLKNQRIDEDNERKVFHARPAPSYVAVPSSIVAKNSSKPSSSVNGVAPLSFQDRNEILLKKKKDTFDRMVEREKQARIFHAKPAPNFKPVFVRGASAENLRANSTNEIGATMPKKIRQRVLSQGSMINDNRENTAPNIVTTSFKVENSKVPQIPKLKIPLMTQNRKINKTAM